MFKYLGSIFIIFSLCLSAVNAASLRISAEALNQLMQKEKIVILDVRDKNDYDVGHIKGAISFPVSFTYFDKKLNGKIQQPKRMQQLLQEKGIDTQTKVIIYDEGNIIDAARMFWTLEVYGISQLQLLDRGYKYWRSKSFSTSQLTPKIKPSQYIATLNHKRLASKFSTQLAIKNENKVVLDARSLAAYRGEVSVAKRFGHIPSAVSVPFNHNIIQNSKFKGLKPLQDLKGLYSAIPKNKKVIIYCKIGRVSSTNYFALRELGYDVANYDASWREWGNDETLPIEK